MGESVEARAGGEVGRVQEHPWKKKEFRNMDRRQQNLDIYKVGTKKI